MRLRGRVVTIVPFMLLAVVAATERSGWGGGLTFSRENLKGTTKTQGDFGACALAVAFDPLASAYTNSPTLYLSGTYCFPAVTGTTQPMLTVAVDDAVIASAAPDTSGAFAIDVPLGADGAHTIVATLVNSDGTTASATTSVILVTTPPSIVLSGVPPTPIAYQRPLLVAQIDAAAPLVEKTATLGGVVIPLTPVYAHPPGCSHFSRDCLVDLPTDRYVLNVSLSEGDNVIALRAADAAGNVTVATYDIQLDTTPPALTLVSPTTGSAVGVATFPVTFSIADASAVTTSITLGGVTQTVSGAGLQTVNVTALAEGVSTITISSTDAAGNVSAPFTFDVLVDLSLPILSIDRLGAPLADGLVLGPQPGDLLLCSLRVDALASTTTTLPDGEIAGFPRGGGVLANADPLVEGINTLVWRTTDEVGRTTELARSVVYDKTPPVGSFTSPTTSSFVRGSIELAATATDNLTGVASVVFQVDGGTAIPASSADGTSWQAVVPTVGSASAAGLADGPHTVTASFTDGVGNATSTSVQIYVDNTPPTVSVAPLAAYVRGAVALNAQAQDAGGLGTISIALNGTPQATCAGVTGCATTIDTTTLSDGPFLVSAVATDLAGNTSVVAQVSAYADNSLPSHFLTAPVDGAVVTGPFAVSVSVQDVDFAGVQCSLDGVLLGSSSSPTFVTTATPTGADGAHSVSCTATDLAGNVATETATISLRRWRFELEPATINTRSRDRDDRVRLEIEGEGLAQLLPVSSHDLKLLVPGGMPVRVSPSQVRADLDDGPRSELALSLYRNELVAALRGGLAAGLIQPRRAAEAKVFDGARLIGTVTFRAEP